MPKESKQIRVTLPQDIIAEINALKQDKYQDKPQSEVMRDLIVKGLKSVESEEKQI